MSKACLTKSRRRGFMAPRTPPRNSSKPMSPELSLSKNLNSWSHSFSVSSRAHSAMAFLNSSVLRVPLPLSSMMRNLRPRPMIPLAPLEASCFLRRSMISVMPPAPEASAREVAFFSGFFLAAKPRESLRPEEWMSVWSAATAPFLAPFGAGLPTLFFPGASPTPPKVMEEAKEGFVFLVAAGSPMPMTSTPCFLRRLMISAFFSLSSVMRSRPRSSSISTTLCLPEVSVMRTRLLAELAHQPSPPEMCQALRIMSSK
mmetsp:Transcript_22786/g.47463  ORF Transcript_22786/g.47463 Transcript_22786/m.47463 type:complete len:258 (-) Transcript_22786:957-1730(-)